MQLDTVLPQSKGAHIFHETFYSRRHNKKQIGYLIVKVEGLSTVEETESQKK